MKIYVTNPPTISIAAWLRRYATVLIVVALVVLGTLGAGVAQALYSNAAPRIIVSGTSVKTNVALDQHERHAPVAAAAR
jgi:hypothetical protein